MHELAYSVGYVSEPVGVEGNGDSLFKNKVAVQVLREFQGFPPRSVTSGSSDGAGLFVDSTIMVLARLDAWVGTVVSCMRQPEGRGGQRQRIFHSMFSKYLPLATVQLLRYVRTIVELRHPKELEYRLLGGDGDEDEDDDPFGNKMRTATDVVRVPSESAFYLAVREHWFTENVSEELGAILDCYVGRCAGPGLPFHPIVETVEEQEGLDASTGPLVDGVMDSDEDVAEDSYNNWLNPVADMRERGRGGDYDQVADSGLEAVGLEKFSEPSPAV